jgi:hypothetical protein
MNDSKSVAASRKLGSSLGVMILPSLVEFSHVTGIPRRHNTGTTGAAGSLALTLEEVFSGSERTPLAKENGPEEEDVRCAGTLQTVLAGADLLRSY